MEPERHLGLDPCLPLDPGSGHWLCWGGLLSKSLPSPELCSSYKGLSVVLLRSPASPAPHGSPIPGLLCFPAPWASCWVRLLGHLVCCAIPSPEDTLSGLSKEDTEDGLGQGEKAPVLPVSTLTSLPAIEPLPCTTFCAGFWDPQDVQS